MFNRVFFLKTDFCWIKQKLVEITSVFISKKFNLRLLISCSVLKYLNCEEGNRGGVESTGRVESTGGMESKCGIESEGGVESEGGIETTGSTDER